MKPTIDLKKSLTKSQKYLIFTEYYNTYRYINESGGLSPYLTYRREWDAPTIEWPIYSDIKDPYTIKADSYEQAFEEMKEDFFHRTTDTGRYKLKSSYNGIYFLVPIEVLKATRIEARIIISNAIEKSKERRNKNLISNIFSFITVQNCILTFILLFFTYVVYLRLFACSTSWIK